MCSSQGRPCAWSAGSSRGSPSNSSPSPNRRVNNCRGTCQHHGLGAVGRADAWAQTGQSAGVERWIRERGPDAVQPPSALLGSTRDAPLYLNIRTHHHRMQVVAPNNNGVKRFRHRGEILRPGIPDPTPLVGPQSFRVPDRPSPPLRVDDKVTVLIWEGCSAVYWEFMGTATWRMVLR